MTLFRDELKIFDAIKLLLYSVLPLIKILIHPPFDQYNQARYYSQDDMETTTIHSVKKAMRNN